MSASMLESEPTKSDISSQISARVRLLMSAYLAVAAPSELSSNSQQDRHAKLVRRSSRLSFLSSLLSRLAQRDQKPAKQANLAPQLFPPRLASLPILVSLRAHQLINDRHFLLVTPLWQACKVDVEKERSFLRRVSMFSSLFSHLVSVETTSTSTSIETETEEGNRTRNEES